MKIILNLEFCKNIWKSDIKKVKEPYRTKKLREYCYKLVRESNKKLTDRDRTKLINGIKHFLKSYEETEIEIEVQEEDGKFFELGQPFTLELGSCVKGN